jgi:hypothetical protein
MDLLDRYLHAVKFFLPQKHQDDIVRELSENLISQMEDRQDELGRPLTEEEAADILRRHGHPMIVATRYRSRQQLIGPVFFPIYLFSLKLGLGASLLITAILAAINGVLQGDLVHYAVREMLAFPGRALMMFAWTTLGFAALDMAQARLKLKHDWDPRKLPKVIDHEYRISRPRAIGELLFTVASLVWLLLLPRMPFLLLGPAAAFLEPAPIWPLAYVPLLLLTLATAALHAANVARPYWTKSRSLVRVGLQAAAVLIFALLLRADEWFIPASTATVWNGVHVERLAGIINVSFQIGFLVAAIISAIEALRELHRLNVRRQASHTADSAV